VRDEEDREADRDPAWHNLEKVAKKMNGYDDKTDISYLAEYILQDERGFIEWTDVPVTDLSASFLD
jgi:hypothetical protein